MSTSKNNNNDDKLYYWLTLIALFLFSLIAGFIGFQRYFDQQGEIFTWVRSLYCSLQLFAFEGGDLRGYIPWELQLARFVAPLTAVMAFIVTLTEIFKDRLNQIKISRMKNHVVIIGFGTKGKNIREEHLHDKEKVLVIDNNPMNPNLATIKSSGSRFLMGDSNNESILKKAGIIKSKSVFLLTRDDTHQVDTCLLIYKLIRDSNRDENNALNCIMHLQQKEFLNTMRAHQLVRDVHDGLSLTIFNVHENSARELFEENPPDRMGIQIDSQKYVQILIFGFGRTGEALALQTALSGHYLNGKKPRVVIIDRLAKTKVEDFKERYPTYTDYCEIEYLTLEADNPQLLQYLSVYLKDHDAITTIVLCFNNKTNNLLLGLQLENVKLNEFGETPQIFVRTNDNDSFFGISQNLKPYGLPSRVCSKEAILGGSLDKKAKAIHNDYITKREKASDFGTRKADTSWEILSQEYKDSNRKAADHIGVKMRGIGCEIVNDNDPRPEAILSDVEIKKLSELEHRRWNAERSLAGWVYNEQRNDRARKTPYLTDWENLPEDVKDYDRNTVKNIPNILSIVGMKAVRHE